MLHKKSASPLCGWQVKIFIFLTVYLTGSGSKGSAPPLQQQDFRSFLFSLLFYIFSFLLIRFRTFSLYIFPIPAAFLTAGIQNTGPHFYKKYLLPSFPALPYPPDILRSLPSRRSTRREFSGNTHAAYKKENFWNR